MPLKYRRRRPEDREKFTVPLNQRKGPPPGPEILPWYWHPDREGAQPPPAAFKAKLKEIDPDLGVCYSPVHERWMIWVKNDRITHYMCRGKDGRGWQLLFLWEHPVTHAFLPLNELVFHNLFYASAKRFPNAEQYYLRIQAEIEREKAARDAAYTNDREAQQNEHRESLQISSAGRGNRFALHHDNVGVPSRGEANWRAETRTQRLPSAQLKQELDDKERAFYGR